MMTSTEDVQLRECILFPINKSSTKQFPNKFALVTLNVPKHIILNFFHIDKKLQNTKVPTAVFRDIKEY